MNKENFSRTIDLKNIVIDDPFWTSKQELVRGGPLAFVKFMKLNIF